MVVAVWCCYEVGSALDMHQEGKKFEMATVLPDGSAVVISDGVTAEDTEQGKELQWEHKGAEYAHKAHRERSFPMKIAENLLRALLQNGEASVKVTAAPQLRHSHRVLLLLLLQEDRDRILSSLTGQPLNAVPLSDHPNYTALNTKLNFRVGVAIYEAATADNSLDRCAIVVVGFVLMMGGVCGRLGLRKLAAPEGWDVGYIYHSRGQALKEQHKLDLAVDLLEKALSYREATLGKTDFKTLDTASCLAHALTDKGEFDRAQELLEAREKVGAVTGTGRLLWYVLSALGRRSAACGAGEGVTGTTWVRCITKSATWTAQQSCLSSRLMP